MATRAAHVPKGHNGRRGVAEDFSGTGDMPAASTSTEYGQPAIADPVVKRLDRSLKKHALRKARAKG